MSFKSRKMIASMAAALALIIIYIIYALGGRAPATDDLKAWGLAMLIFIGISVVVMIVIQILFHITFAIGIAVKEGIAALISLVTGNSALVAIHIVFGSFFIGSGAEGIAGVWLYERGVRNG